MLYLEVVSPMMSCNVEERVDGVEDLKLKELPFLGVQNSKREE